MLPPPPCTHFRSKAGYAAISHSTKVLLEFTQKLQQGKAVGAECASSSPLTHKQFNVAMEVTVGPSTKGQTVGLRRPCRGMVQLSNPISNARRLPMPLRECPPQIPLSHHHHTSSTSTSTSNSTTVLTLPFAGVVFSLQIHSGPKRHHLRPMQRPRAGAGGHGRLRANLRQAGLVPAVLPPQRPPQRVALGAAQWEHHPQAQHQHKTQQQHQSRSLVQAWQ